MTRVLITAFEPYGNWPLNSSWLALVELTKDLPQHPQVTTRLYPVDFARVREKLTQDLAADFDFAIHLGQAPGQAKIILEAVGVNVRNPAHGSAEIATEDAFGRLVEDGPAAYFSQLPVSALAERLRAVGIPAGVSHNAGTYVCNATLYLSHYLAQRMALRTRIGFLHVPLETSQAAGQPGSVPSLPATLVAVALRELIAALAEPGSPPG